jgi:hypothetical protein
MSKERIAVNKNKPGTFAKYLREGKEVYEQGQQFESMNEKIDPGTYLAKLSLIEWRISKNNSLMLHREHIIVEGENKGRKISDNMVYGAHEIGTGIIRGYLKMVTGEKDLPADPADLEELVQRINHEFSYQCKVRVSDQKDSDFQRATIQEIYNDDNIPEDSEQSPEPKKTDRVKVTRVAAKADEDGPDVLFTRLSNFCEAQGIDLDGTESDEGIKAIIDKYDYPEEDLKEGGWDDFLRELDMEARIIKSVSKREVKKKR